MHSERNEIFHERFLFFEKNNIFANCVQKCISTQKTHYQYFNQLKLKTMGIITSIIIGILAGYLAGKIMKGSGFGLLINIIVGTLGGFIGGQVLGWLGIEWGEKFIGQVITATIGAIILLWLISLIKKK